MTPASPSMLLKGHILVALASTYFTWTQHGTSKRSSARKLASRSFLRSRGSSRLVRHASHETTAPVKVRGSLVRSSHGTVSRTNLKSHPAFSGDATRTRCKELLPPPPPSKDRFCTTFASCTASALTGKRETGLEIKNRNSQQSSRSARVQRQLRV